MIVGLTGGIGSGKTYVASLFGELGVPVYISDVEAKKIMNTQPDVIKSIIEIFGKKAYVDGQLDRKFIASQVFTKKEKLNQLNSIVHPAVANHFKNWHKQQNSVFVIKESAILFETKGNKYCDSIILVTAPEEIRILRVIKRDHVSEEEVKNRIKNQWSDEQKKLLSNYVISNIDKSKTKNKVKEIYRIIINSLTSC